MNIGLDELVLEVGSGDLPYYRSNVLLDKYPDDPSQRLGDLVIDRPFVVGSAEALPFADKSFDYIIASQVLEHSLHPDKFFNELSRVGKRGYIETPSALRERLFDWPFHRWYIYKKGKKLILIKKTGKSNTFFAEMKDQDRRELYYLESKDFFNIRFEWIGKIAYKIIENESETFLIHLDNKLVHFLKERKKDPRYWQTIFKHKALKIPGVAKTNLFLKSWLFKTPRKPKDLISRYLRNKLDIFSILVCPVCKGKLLFEPKKILCQVCGRNFPYYNHLGEKYPNLSV